MHILRNLKLFKECIEYYELAIKINDTKSLCFYEYGTVLHKELNSVGGLSKALKLANYKMYNVYLIMPLYYNAKKE